MRYEVIEMESPFEQRFRIMDHHTGLCIVSCGSQNFLREAAEKRAGRLNTKIESLKNNLGDKIFTGNGKKCLSRAVYYIGHEWEGGKCLVCGSVTPEFFLKHFWNRPPVPDWWGTEWITSFTLLGVSHYFNHAHIIDTLQDHERVELIRIIGVHRIHVTIKYECIKFFWLSDEDLQRVKDIKQRRDESAVKSKFAREAKKYGLPGDEDEV